MSIITRLRKKMYENTPLEGLEECLPRFQHGDVVLQAGKKRKRGGSRNRRSRMYSSKLWQFRRKNP